MEDRMAVEARMAAVEARMPMDPGPAVRAAAVEAAAMKSTAVTARGERNARHAGERDRQDREDRDRKSRRLSQVIHGDTSLSLYIHGTSPWPGPFKAARSGSRAMDACGRPW